MSKATKIIISILAALFLCSFFVSSFRTCGRDDPKKEEPTIEEPSDDIPGEKFSIAYYAIIDDKREEIYEGMWAKNGSYPASYVSGKETVISDLLGKMTPVEWEGFEGTYIGAPVSDKDNPRKDYSFYGWYWDAGLENAFDGTIGENQTGDITLYAKIEIGYWTNNH